MQTLENINVGQAPNDGTGDDNRKAFQKVNANFSKVVEGVGEAATAAQEAGEVAAAAIPATAKGRAGGVATLGDDGKVSPDQLPNAVDAIPLVQKGAAGGVATLNGAGQVPADQLTLAVLAAQKGAAGGVAQLDGVGRLPAGQLPAVTQALWNGATLNLTGTGTGAVVTGDFPGTHSATAVRFKGLPASAAGATYVQAVPAAAGGTAAFLARENETPNASFVTLANDTTNNVARILFSRHGTGSVLSKLVIQSVDQECGSIGRLGDWTFGVPPAARAANTAQTATYAGGTTQWGLLMAPRNLNDGAAIAFQNTSGSLVGSVTTSATATSFNVASDYRLKNLKGDSDKEAGRARIMAVKIRDFTWKADGQDDTGVLAHELADTHPRAVTGEKDAVMEMAGFEGLILPQSVDYSKLVPDLVLAVQRQQQLIEEMRAEIDALKASGLVAGAAGAPAN